MSPFSVMVQPVQSILEARQREPPRKGAGNLTLPTSSKQPRHLQTRICTCTHHWEQRGTRRSAGLPSRQVVTSGDHNDKRTTTSVPLQSQHVTDVQRVRSSLAFSAIRNCGRSSYSVPPSVSSHQGLRFLFQGLVASPPRWLRSHDLMSSVWLSLSQRGPQPASSSPQ